LLASVQTNVGVVEVGSSLQTLGCESLAVDGQRVGISNPREWPVQKSDQLLRRRVDVPVLQKQDAFLIVVGRERFGLGGPHNNWPTETVRQMLRGVRVPVMRSWWVGFKDVFLRLIGPQSTLCYPSRTIHVRGPFLMDTVPVDRNALGGVLVCDANLGNKYCRR